MLRIASCLLVLSMTGCATGADPVTARDYTVHPGERITLAGPATLTYIGVAQDSRCPPKVQCIHAGSADVRLHYTGTDGDRDITLRTGEATTATVGARRLQLLDLAFGDAPALTVRIEPLP